MQDLGLLGALGDVDRRLTRALGLGDDGAPCPLGGQLAVHRVLDVARRGDLADLDGRDLAAPALGDLVELDAQDLVDLVALGQHVVEQDVADHGAEGGRRDVLEGALEVLDLDDAPVGVDDPPVDQEVDADRGVVLRDARLARDLDEPLAKVDAAPPRWAIGTMKTQPGPLTSVGLVRPSVKTSTRSYWLTILIDAIAMTAMIRTTNAAARMVASSTVSSYAPSGDVAGPDSTMSIRSSWPTTRTGWPDGIGASPLARARPFLACGIHDAERLESRSGDARRPLRDLHRTAGPVVTRERERPPTDAGDGDEDRSTNTPVTAAIATTSGTATATSGAAGVPGAVYRVKAPSTKQTSPPTVSRPWLVTVVSRMKSRTASPIRIRPAMLSGRLPKPMKARISAMAPSVPVTKFGLWSSNSRP